MESQGTSVWQIIRSLLVLYAGGDYDDLRTNSSSDNTSDYFPSKSSDSESHDVRKKKKQKFSRHTFSRNVPAESSSGEDHNIPIHVPRLSAEPEESRSDYKPMPPPLFLCPLAADDNSNGALVTGFSDRSSDESEFPRLQYTHPIEESAVCQVSYCLGESTRQQKTI